MTIEELEKLVNRLQEQIVSLQTALNEYATTDDLSAITDDIKELQTNSTTVQTSVAALETKMKKINHLENLLDVSIYNITEDDLLQYGSDGKWHNINPGKLGIANENGTSTITSLGSLTDVQINDVENNQVLIYNSVDGKWTNGTIDLEQEPVDLSAYLTKRAAEDTYFKIEGGEITGNVSMRKSLSVNENITTIGNIYADGAITAKAAAE